MCVCVWMKERECVCIVYIHNSVEMEGISIIIIKAVILEDLPYTKFFNLSFLKAEESQVKSGLPFQDNRANKW